MKNFSKRKAAALCLSLSAGWAVSAHSFEMPASYKPNKPTSLMQQAVTGTVSDSSGPLPGVTVSVKGKAQATITDTDGKFSIVASEGDVLVFSSIGFQTKELSLGRQTTVNLVLQEAPTALQEVTINAGYYTVKDKERTGSIAKITAKDLETQPVTNVLAAMQGRMAGVSITQTTGVPGGGFDIKIRGTNSLRNDANAPLYIIDGVPYSSQAIGSDYTSSIFPTPTSPLNSINPDAIESIEVLKDADATAIYGSRGANGVVLITTKKGKTGKTQVQVNASTGVGQVTRFIDLMDTRQYLAMRRQAFINDDLTEFGPADYDVNGTWDQNRDTNWQKELLGGTAEISALQATISGGSEHTQFLFGTNHHTETTVFPGDFNYRKGGGNFSLSHRSSDDRLKLTLSANYIAQNNVQPAYDFTRDSWRLAPNAPALYDQDGNLNWENSTWANPLANNAAEFKARTNDLSVNGVISYAILPSLEVKLSAGYNDTRHRETRISPSTIYDPAYGLGSESSGLFASTTARRSWIAEPQLSYQKTFGSHRINLLAGGSFQHQISNVFTAYGFGFGSNSLIYNMAAASFQQVILDGQSEYKYQAFFGRINYNFKERYILNLTGRRDGSSRFGPGRQFANFGALGAAWLFSKEALLAESSWLSFGKLRASYGTTGNDQIGDYQFLDTYTASSDLYQGVVGLQPSRLFNPDFGWETNKKLELAIELGFLKDRLYLTAAYFRNRSSNQLVGLPLPGTTGFDSIQFNLDATVQNAGWEFTLRSSNIDRPTFKWITNINLSRSRNELISFPGLAGSAYANQYRIGMPLNIMLGYDYQGLNTDTGLYQFRDLDGDGQITAPNDQQIAMDLTPDYFGGLQNQITYKNWSLDFLFQFVKQRNFAFGAGNGGMLVNQPATLENSWAQPGDPGPYQVLTTGLNEAALLSQSQFSMSNAQLVDASFIRLKNISLSYNLPFPQKHFSCKLIAQAQNLLTLTSYDGGDPEFATPGFLPPLRVITGGVQLNF